MQKNEVSYSYLLGTFLKIGFTSFGGFIALVAIVKKQLVDKDRVVTNDTILDGISLTSIMPGPLAVNTVAYVGYQLRGLRGALLSAAAVVFPSFLLMCSLGYLYFEYGQVAEIKSAFKAVVPAVFSIVLAVAYQMGRKSVKDFPQAGIAFFSALLFYFLGGIFLTFALIAAGAFLGSKFYYEKPEKAYVPLKGSKKKTLLSIIALISLCLLFLPALKLLGLNEENFFGKGVTLLGTFSSLSISLFGGGYVFIPVMQEVIVDNYAWLLPQEFADGIALGQITPGPIMITSTFVGYKVLGVIGALLATIGMFLPPALLTIFCSHIFDVISSSPVAKAALKGVRPVVVGMIVSAAFVIGRGVEHTILTYLIAAFVLLLSVFTQIHCFFFILGSGLLGMYFF